MLEQIRKLKNLSVQEVANKTGLTRQAIYKLEQGEYKPKLETVIKLSEALGVSIQEISNCFKEEK